MTFKVQQQVQLNLATFSANVDISSDCHISELASYFCIYYVLASELSHQNDHRFRKVVSPYCTDSRRLKVHH